MKKRLHNAIYLLSNVFAISNKWLNGWSGLTFPLDEQYFSKKFNLGYNFTSDDYQYALEQLARDGHLILKTIDDQKTAIFYIPEVVTNRQIEWFEYNKFELLHNDLIGAFSINSDEEELEQIYGLSEIKKEIRKKNILYRKEVENHVGKKI